VVEDGRCSSLCLGTAEEKEFFHSGYCADECCEFLCFWICLKKGLKHTFGFLLWQLTQPPRDKHFKFHAAAFSEMYRNGILPKSQ